MSLPFFTQKKLEEQFYLGLFLKEQEGFIIVLTTKNGKMEIREKEKFVYTNGWENLTEDVDEALFKIEKNLNIQLKKTIFFIYSHLLNEKGTEIKKQYLTKIKELVKNLELTPLGYIECYEAVSLYLTEKEEIPLTAIVVELDTTRLTIFIYKGGRVFYRKILLRTKNLANDLTTGFEELKGKFLLPTRIVLYNSKDLDDESTKILTHRWTDEYFVQLPKVEILREEEVIEGLVKTFEKQKLIVNQNKLPQEEEKKKEVLGFVIGGDVVERRTSISIPSKTFYLSDKLLSIIRKINLPKMDIALSQKLLTAMGILLITSGLIINEIFFHKATLKIFLPTVTINKSTVVKIPYEIATVSAEISHSKVTSGKREIGEKARGEVIIYNTNLNKEKLFKKGTEIDLEGLKFTFDDEIKVATASNATTPGVAKVKVTAVAIGPEYNLSKGRRFNIDDTSYAEVSTMFSGGLRREIQSISRKDLEDLKIAILEKAKKNNNLTFANRGEKIIIPQFSDVILKETLASGEVGEEALSVSLKAKVESIHYYYRKKQLIEKLSDILKSQIPPGFVLNKEAINYNIESVLKEKKEFILHLSLKAKAVKQISQADILKKVTGKHKSSLPTILQGNFQVQGYDLNIKEPLMILKDFLPFVSGNITLVFSTL